MKVDPHSTCVWNEYLKNCMDTFNNQLNLNTGHHCFYASHVKKYTDPYLIPVQVSIIMMSDSGPSPRFYHLNQV